MDVKANSNDLLLLVYTLGIIGIAINIFAYYKKKNEYSGLILDDKGALKNITHYLEGDDGMASMANLINKNYKKLSFLMVNDSYFIMSSDKNEILQKDLTFKRIDDPNATLQYFFFKRE